MIEELARHDYKLSAGMLYPMLRSMEKKGYLVSQERRAGRSIRRVHKATLLGREALEMARGRVRELIGEMMERRWSAGRSSHSVTAMGGSTMSERTFHVLFLSRRNSARSILAGLALPAAPPKHYSEYTKPDAPALDFVFTLSDTAAGEPLPEWPGLPVTAHWSSPDPILVTGPEWERKRAFARVLTEYERRLSIFVNLPFASLDRMSLKSKLDEIGWSGPAATS